MRFPDKGDGPRVEMEYDDGADELDNCQAPAHDWESSNAVVALQTKGV